MLNKLLSFFEILSDLGKFKITVFVAFSTSVGFILSSGSLEIKLIWTLAGVFLLASGSSALNEYQEKDRDALMARTMNRPIPSGRISPASALIFSIAMLISGFGILFIFTDFSTLMLGFTALVWYNVIYTPLKIRYAMAVVPGSIIGAIPPVMGWTASGGDLSHPGIMALALFFFIWQIPHFWLLVLLYDQDYQRAAFPTITQIYNNTQINRMTFIWIVSLGISSLLIPVFNNFQNIFVLVFLSILALWISIFSFRLVSQGSSRLLLRKTFLIINLYVLSVVAIIAIDKLIF
ncbi:MAG: protoheme IX farnesyltransferase [Ignavibacteriales bacterium]|nr:protoheme IX farnesyltransferase [Ignavibacteriales bacterium]